jgi:hypothetical protein
MINNYRLIFVKIRYVITTRLTSLLIVTNKCCHHPPNLDDLVILLIVVVFFLLELVPGTIALFIFIYSLLWGLVWDVLRTKFKGGNVHISKLAYKCMRYENMKPIDIKNDSNSLKTVNLILELKTRLILFNLTLITLCNKLKLFRFKNSLFSLFPIMFHVMKPN